MKGGTATLPAPAAAAVGAAPPLLEVEGLGHRFGDRPVLDGVSLRLSRGEALGLLGPNGSGKSTLIGVLAGLLPRQAGRLRWQGREIERPARAYRSTLGVVFQSPSLDPKLTARQNLELAARLHGLSRRRARLQAERALAGAGLAERAADQVAKLSGGMRRRIDLARALVHHPELLLVDEPTAGLDEAAFRQAWQALDAARRDAGLAVIVATHRAEEAERCDRLLLLVGGRVVAEDTPEGLRRRVSGDVVVLTGTDPAGLASEVEARFGLAGLIADGDVLVETERGHEWIPRLVEALPPGRLAAVALRRPTLADAFLKLTGHGLDERPPAALGGA